MQSKHKLLLILMATVVFILINAFGTIAQTSNDPGFNENANACFEGGSMAGVCDNLDVDGDEDVDEHDRNWMWRCGWYLIRVELGYFDESVLDDICREIIEIVIVEKKEKKEKKERPSETPEPQIPT